MSNIFIFIIIILFFFRAFSTRFFVFFEGRGALIFFFPDGILVRIPGCMDGGFCVAARLVSLARRLAVLIFDKNHCSDLI
jgi:hypothetical protein